MTDLNKVYVYPDGEVYDNPPAWKSDDFEVRIGGFCTRCDDDLYIHYGEPLASCKCGTQEWHG